jgi:nickel-type superoxide dismutase maturation protease
VKLLLRLTGFVLAFIFVRRVAGRFFRVEVQGESMLPALQNGDWLIVDRRAYRAHPPRRGDIVLARDPRDLDRMLIKRIDRVHADGAITLRGDNSDVSTDSREFGAVPAYLVEGRVLGRYWPRPSFVRR